MTPTPDMTDTRPITRHYVCSLRPSVHCTVGEGKPRVAKCRYCGGQLLLSDRWWGLFIWRGDGRYVAEDALSWHRGERAAEKAAAAHPDDMAVPRPVLVPDSVRFGQRPIR